MFDTEEKKKGRTLQEPIPTDDPHDFPHTDEVPEGCIVRKDQPADWPCLVDVHPDVVYTKRNGTPLHLIILEPRPSGSASETEKQKEHQYPCVVYIQGSAFHTQWLWNHISRHIRLAEQGIAVAVVEYRPSEVSPFPAQAEDAKTAVRYLRSHASEYHIDPDHMALMGDSSGGHTALTAGFTGDRCLNADGDPYVSASVSCIVDLYGPTVFALMNYWPSSQNHYEPDSPEGYEIGHLNVLEHPERADRTIPMNYVEKDIPTPPVLIIHGGRDMLVPFNQSVQLYRDLKEKGKDVTFYKIDQAGHGSMGFDNDQTMKIIIDYLKEHI
jgi:acetyl esterase/lipase